MATYGSAQDEPGTNSYPGNSLGFSLDAFTSDALSNSASGSTNVAYSTQKQTSTSTRADEEILLKSPQSETLLTQRLPPTRGSKTFWLGIILAAVLFFSAVPRIYDPNTGEFSSMSDNLADFNRNINKHLPAKLRLNPVVAISAVSAVLALVGLGELVQSARIRYKANMKAGAMRSPHRLRGIGLLIAASVALFLAFWIQPNPAISMTRARNTSLAIAAATGAAGLLHLIRSLALRSAFSKSKKSAFRASNSELLDKGETGDMQENADRAKSPVIFPTPTQEVLPQKEASN